MYQINFPRVVHETLEGETIIIDTLTGYYYTARGPAATIWNALADGCSPAVIKMACASTQGEAAEHLITAFVDSLTRAELIKLADKPGPQGECALPLFTADDLTDLRLECHADMQELMELDPIHEIDVGQGWPYPSKEGVS
jgi:hypothetical protein